MLVFIPELDPEDIPDANAVLIPELITEVIPEFRPEFTPELIPKLAARELFNSILTTSLLLLLLLLLLVVLSEGAIELLLISVNILLIGWIPANDVDTLPLIACCSDVITPNMVRFRYAK